MKFIVFSLSLFALLILTPQIVFADDDLRKFLTPIQDSNYVIFAQMEIRDSSEQLTGVIIPRSYYYLDHQLTEKLLDQVSVKEIIFLNSRNYELREITTEITLQENNHFLDRISLTYNSNTIFYGTDLGYVIAQGDKLTTKWKILTLTD